MNKKHPEYKAEEQTKEFNADNQEVTETKESNEDNPEINEILAETKHPESQKQASQEPNYKQLAEEYKDLLQRLQAEFDNYKKRVEKEKQELCQFAKHSLIKQLLNIYDDFERLLENIHEEQKAPFQMMFKNFKKTLEEEGLKQIDAKGKKLDPFKHEVMTHIKGDLDDIVVQELQKGYTLNNAVIRTTKVIVSKKDKSSGADSKNASQNIDKKNFKEE